MADVSSDRLTTAEMRRWSEMEMEMHRGWMDPSEATRRAADGYPMSAGYG